jgi:hypothetical protein
LSDKNPADKVRNANNQDARNHYEAERFGREDSPSFPEPG